MRSAPGACGPFGGLRHSPAQPISHAPASTAQRRAPTARANRPLPKLAQLHDTQRAASWQCSLAAPPLLLLLLLALLLPCQASASTESWRATASSFHSLVAALQDATITEIQIPPGTMVLDPVFAASVAPVTIGTGRSVTISGTVAPMPSNASQTFFATRLDLQGFSNLLRLADHTSLTLRSLELHNFMAKLGYDLPFVATAPRAANVTVRFESVVRVRDACLPLGIFVTHISSYTRLPGAPGAQAVAQQQPLCYGQQRPDAVVGSREAAAAPAAVTCVNDALAVYDLATPISRPTAGQAFAMYESGPGYYYCGRYASIDCLSVSSPDDCIDALLSASNSSGSSQLAVSGSSDSSSSLSAVLLPAIITGVVVVLLVGSAAWWLRRRRLARMAEAAAKATDAEAGAKGGADSRGAAAGGGKAGDAYQSVISREALERIAQVRQELSGKVVSASSTDDLSDVRVLQLVGHGTFGRVYKADWKGVTVALKVITIPVTQYGQQQWQQLLGEAAISTLLNHPNILQTYSVALLEYAPKQGDGPPPTTPTAVVNAEQAQPGVTSADSGNSNSGPLLDPFYQLKLVSEYCDGGTIRSALARMRFYNTVDGSLRLPVVVDMALQVASAMCYLHSAGIVHADLKAANVLLKHQPGSGRLLAKVADFGLSFRLDPEATHITRRQLGTVTHMSPEALLLGKVSKASDVYAFGVLMYELYTGQPAYESIPGAMLAYHVSTQGGRPAFPPDTPNDIRALARACWATDPSIRPTFREILLQLEDLSRKIQVMARSFTEVGAPAGAGAAAAAAAAQSMAAAPGIALAAAAAAASPAPVPVPAAVPPAPMAAAPAEVPHAQGPGAQALVSPVLVGPLNPTHSTPNQVMAELAPSRESTHATSNASAVAPAEGAAPPAAAVAPAAAGVGAPPSVRWAAIAVVGEEPGPQVV